jgi:hypothetical protein
MRSRWSDGVAAEMPRREEQLVARGILEPERRPALRDRHEALAAQNGLALTLLPAGPVPALQVKRLLDERGAETAVHLERRAGGAAGFREQCGIAARHAAVRQVASRIIPQR